jgi:hypothetical protein
MSPDPVLEYALWLLIERNQARADDAKRHQTDHAHDENPAGSYQALGRREGIQDVLVDLRALLDAVAAR